MANIDDDASDDSDNSNQDYIDSLSDHIKQRIIYIYDSEKKYW